MKRSRLNKPLPMESIVTGTFSKKEAALRISRGTRHVHSTVLGTNDPCVRITEESISRNTSPSFPWEPKSTVESIQIEASSDRSKVIQRVLEISGFESKRSSRERLSSVLEELLSNSIYHAYQNRKGHDKYQRKTPVTLLPEERLTLSFFSDKNGVYLALRDQGGNLSFDSFAKSLARCYGESGDQIEDKLGGAGLGIYLIFENATHIKVEVIPGKETVFSCWISEKSSFNPDHFSFNFFERK